MPRRPVVHFTPRSGWLNDPLGVTFRNGRYHLFFQHVPGATEWDFACHWGHATSADLLHWREEPVALFPGDGDEGVWSGSIAVRDDDSAVLFYTSAAMARPGVGRVRAATSDDPDWTVWRKGDVVVTAPEPPEFAEFRDPFVFRDGRRWGMLVGSGFADGDAAASFFSSDDLATWTYEGIAAQRSSAQTSPWTGAAWECPQLFAVDGRHVLVVAVWQERVTHYVAYAVGQWHDGRFHADAWGQLTYGGGYYAPTFFRDTDGQPCLIHWIRGPIDAEAGWAGALSVPHRLALDCDRLVASLHPALAATADDGAGDGAWLVDVPSGDGAAIALAQGDLVIDRLPQGTRVRLATTDELLPGPNRRVQVLIDGPVVEVVSAAGCVAIGLAAADDAAPRFGDLAVRRVGQRRD